MNRREAAQQRIRAAMAHVEAAQQELGRASSALSGVTYMGPEGKKLVALYERVHQFWYDVRAAFEKKSKAEIDGFIPDPIPDDFRGHGGCCTCREVQLTGNASDLGGLR